ncbi:MAG: EF-P lysine aminoacylase GenX [Myxococcaceae bacterium]|nr:EF-P lysine aminoacylase GenX [Myxococcaceae bacterium]
MPSRAQWDAARARGRCQAALRSHFAARGFLEVETPALVPLPGLEPHIDPFETPFVPQTGVGTARPLYLHTSPEYAMKRLLADGSGPIFQLARVYRNGEVSAHHNPEFTMLELYRPHADYRAIMEDTERALAAGAAAAAQADTVFSRTPYERITVQDAVLRATGIDLRAIGEDEAGLAAAASEAGVLVGAHDGYDDVFFHLFLQKVEGTLGRERPTFLCEYPASMASLARLKPADPTVAERVELYVGGVELANGFSELTDATEQRRRFEAEQAQRRAANRPAYPIDERFLDAVERLPPCTGIAVGLDRVLMLAVGAATLAEVLLFPAQEFL